MPYVYVPKARCRAEAEELYQRALGSGLRVCIGLGCPFCWGPALQADPSVPPPRTACVDRECRGAHGWVWEAGHPVPWEERTHG